MKQHIIVEQLISLTREQKMNLNKLVRFLHHDITIGKMIEILNDNNEYDKFHFYKCLLVDIDGDKETVSGWCVEYKKNEFREEELCDALWKAVKEMI